MEILLSALLAILIVGLILFVAHHIMVRLGFDETLRMILLAILAILLVFLANRQFGFF